MDRAPIPSRPAAKRVLVVVYSRTGTAQKVAALLAGRFGADLETLRPSHAYAGRSGFVRGVVEALSGWRALVTCDRDPNAYDLVILVAPVWVGRLAPPMRGYLRRQATWTSSAAAVWVSASDRPYANVGEEIEATLGRPLVATLSLGQAFVDDDKIDLDLAAFAARARRA